MTEVSTLYQMLGLSGSGKSTWVAAHAAGASVLSADEIRLGAAPRPVFARLHAAIPRELAAGDVIVDTRALQAFERTHVLRLGKRAGARCVLVIVDTPWRLCRARNAARKRPAAVKFFDDIAAFQRACKEARLEAWDEVRRVCSR